MKILKYVLNTPFAESMKAEFDHIFWSGPLDAYFGFELGRLGYRTLDLRHSVMKVISKVMQ